MDTIPNNCARTIRVLDALLGCEKSFGHDDQHGCLVNAVDPENPDVPFPVLVSWGQELSPDEFTAIFGFDR